MERFEEQPVFLFKPYLESVKEKALAQYYNQRIEAASGHSFSSSMSNYK
jgi:hypothetical protein|tara:strand:- start:746 stop:892 length:147 start_codon:yes stop_codon:yes gene_type:complete